MRRLLIFAAIIWASPWTLCGLLVGGVALLFGGRVQRTGRVVEFYEGGTQWFLAHCPIVAGATAVTFGHTVLARTRQDLDATRAHEAVHVRQYQYWGPFFIPAYLLCSMALWAAGKHPYFDNPFERQAYREAP